MVGVLGENSMLKGLFCLALMHVGGRWSITSFISRISAGESPMNDDIGELVRQWKEKALSDWTAVEILSSNKNCPPEVVCFHCQQFVEKLLKVLLTRHNISSSKDTRLATVDPAGKNICSGPCSFVRIVG